MSNQELMEEIRMLKKVRDAFVVAHYYQAGEVQEAADVVGDSYALAKACQQSEKKLIVFCGVHFMAESAKILSPKKMVLIPNIRAGCPMADMATPEKVRTLKAEHPNAIVVCYINTSAAVKAECDVCVTSSNAEGIIKKLVAKEIIFLPDMNLGANIAKKFPDKKFIFLEGYCVVHHQVTLDDVRKKRAQFPNAKLLVHPECKPEVVTEADFAGSTKGILEHAIKSEDTEFIIGTEKGIVYNLEKACPQKKFHMLSSCLLCVNMKKTNLELLRDSLAELQYEIEIDEETRKKAEGCLRKMLELAE